MNKVEALENIKINWLNEELKLGEKIQSVSSQFYMAGLDLEATAAFIKATPSELDAFLTLGGLSEETLQLISEVNPPKTTWAILSNANEEEVLMALNSLKNKDSKTTKESMNYTSSEFVYNKMLEISGPTIDQKINNLSGNDIRHILKKGEGFNQLSKKEVGFLNGIVKQKRTGRNISEKQMSWLIDILNRLVECGAVKRNSIDGDQEICDRVLDALGV